MTLKLYHQKRDFKKTPEPKGRAKKTQSKKLFIIQKHAASHLHYDFRLELNGVLLSWAVPKGPCLDPKVKRLAMHVEDHPVEYGSFEGIIPKGQYGGGTVMLWDKGEWICDDANPTAAYKKGDLTFTLKAKKLKGRWKLIRINRDDKTWLLMKLQDDYAKPLKKYDITIKEPNSVLTKQSIDEIAENYKKVWGEKGLVKKKTLAKLTHPEKILYPEGKITKQAVADYYEVIHEWILPYIVNRPLTLVRCPTNYKQCFYQKHLNEKKPAGFYEKMLKEKEGRAKYLYIKDEKGLMALPQLSALELHPWSSRIEKVEYPDMIIFDLDPAPGIPWKKVVAAAFDLKDLLAEIKLKSFVKTTGGKGLHVVVPIKPEYDWEEVKQFSKAVVDYLVLQNPKAYVANMAKAKRVNKIFVDYLRNQRGATAIAPYSTRARKGAPVSVPLDWDELTNNIRDTFYTIETLPKRLEELEKDPWEKFFKVKQSLKLDKLK